MGPGQIVVMATNETWNKIKMSVTSFTRHMGRHLHRWCLTWSADGRLMFSLVSMGHGLYNRPSPHGSWVHDSIHNIYPPWVIQ
jgi:hypothetical protein